MTQIFGITGLPLSGKTTVADKMVESDFEKVDMGDVVREEMKKRDIPVEETGEFVSTLRKQNGMNAIAQLTLPYVKEAIESNDKVVIGGMRGWGEKKCFENNLDHEIEVIAVWASRDTRLKRKESRARDEDQVSNLKERDKREMDQGVSKMMALADHMIVNEYSQLESFEEEIENTLQELEVNN